MADTAETQEQAAGCQGGPTRVHRFPLVPAGPHAPYGAGHRTIGARTTADGTKRMSTRWPSPSARSRPGSRRRRRPAGAARGARRRRDAPGGRARRQRQRRQTCRWRHRVGEAAEPGGAGQRAPELRRGAAGSRCGRHTAVAPPSAGSRRTHGAEPGASDAPRWASHRRAGAAQGGQQRRATFKVKPPRPGPGGSGSGAAACAGAGGAPPAAPGPSCQSESADGTGQGQRGPAAGRASQRSPAGGSAPLCCVWPKGGNLPERLEGRHIKG